MNRCTSHGKDYFQQQEYPNLPILSSRHFELLDHIHNHHHSLTTKSLIGRRPSYPWMTLPFTSMAINNFLIWDIYQYFYAMVCNKDIDARGISPTLIFDLNQIKIEYIQQVQTMTSNLRQILSMIYLPNAPIKKKKIDEEYTPRYILYEVICCSPEWMSIDKSSFSSFAQWQYVCQNFAYCSIDHNPIILAENQTQLSSSAKVVQKRLASYLPLIVESTLPTEIFCTLSAKSSLGKRVCRNRKQEQEEEQEESEKQTEFFSTESYLITQDGNTINAAYSGTRQTKCNNHVNTTDDIVVFKRIYPHRIFQSDSLSNQKRDEKEQKKETESKTDKTSTSWKVAVVTAIYGRYEFSAKPFARQSIPTDFIVFTDREDIVAPGWIVDTFPYYLEALSRELEENITHEVNAYFHNQHPFNIAKYFKQSFHRIPILQSYDSVIWIDGTISITNYQMSEIITNIFMNFTEETVIAFEHFRNGSMTREASVSFIDRYLNTMYLQHEQPVQDLVGQHTHYLQSGYTDDYWKLLIQNHQVNGQYSSSREQYGLWCTCFVAWNMKFQKKKVEQFLNSWSNENRKFSTQDQVSFPYVAQMEHIHPYSLPDDNIVGSYDFNTLFVKLYHGM
jgi:hypothetical protein